MTQVAQIFEEEKRQALDGSVGERDFNCSARLWYHVLHRRFPCPGCYRQHAVSLFRYLRRHSKGSFSLLDTRTK